MTYALLLAAIHGDDDGAVSPRRAERVSRELSSLKVVDTASAERLRDERAVVERLRASDPDALAELMARYFDALARFAWHIVGARDAAEDVAQDVCVRVWEHRATLDPERPIAAWLFAAARNRALNERKYEHVREKHRHAIEAMASAVALSESVDEEAEIDAWIARLPERQRMAIRLRFVDQLTVPEVAGALDISANAAHQLIFRAIETLRKGMTPRGGTHP